MSLTKVELMRQNILRKHNIMLFKAPPACAREDSYCSRNSAEL